MSIVIMTIIFFPIVVYALRFIVLGIHEKRQREKTERDKAKEKRKETEDKIRNKRKEAMKEASTVAQKIKVWGIDAPTELTGKILNAFDTVADQLTVRPEEEEKSTEEKRDYVQIVSGLGGFIITALGTGLFPILLFPLLDYSVQIQEGASQGNSKTVEVILRNIGFTSAKNVIVSVHADNKIFSSVSSIPYLSTMNTNNNPSGDAYAEIKFLPPKGEVKFTTQASTNDSGDVTLTPYVLSEQGVGKINQLVSVIYYALLAAIYTISFVVIYSVVKISNLKIHHVVITLAVAIIYSIVFYGLAYTVLPS
jgi:hypothetical protein